MAKKQAKKNGQRTAKLPVDKDPSQGEATQFTKVNQPSSEVKKAGWAKKNALKSLLATALTGKDQASEKVRQMMADILGITVEEVKAMTLEDAMHLRQIDKAIKQGNTYAYQAVLDRALGKPIARNQHSGPDGGPIDINPVTWTDPEEEDEGTLKTHKE